MNIEELLKNAKELKASDLHITVGVPPKCRVNGMLINMKYPKVLPPDTEKFMKDITPQKQCEVLERDGEIDFAYAIPKINMRVV